MVMVLEMRRKPKELVAAKHIAISEQNYRRLSSQGGFHETFDSVIGRLLDASQKQNEKKSPQGVTARNEAPSGSFRGGSNNELNPPAKEDLVHVG